MNPELEENPAVHERVLTVVDPIQETHLSEPGLLVIDVAGRDDDTVNAFQSALARTWATAIDRTARDPGQPGVRVRIYVDLRQGLAQTPPPERALVAGAQEAGSVTTGGVTDPA